MKPAAFFDLDGTLLTVNSGRLWMQRERREGRISRWQMAQAIFYLMLYRFGVIDMEGVMKKALSTVAGLEEETLQAWTAAWYEKEVKPYAAPGGFPVLQEHREAGLPLVLLTSSSPYESSVAKVHFDLDFTLCTRYGVADGKLTGEVERPMCYGPGKVEIAERFAAEQGIDLDASFFYTDSITDLPMLERVGAPRVVNPDPRLKRRARERGWPILDWR